MDKHLAWIFFIVHLHYEIDAHLNNMAMHRPFPHMFNFLALSIRWWLIDFISFLDTLNFSLVGERDHI
jgi:hypothetical protein